MPYPPMSLFDTSDDLETWRPFYIDAEESASAPAPYPPTPSYSTTTFLYFCEQAKIMNAMYETIYSPSTAAGIDTDTVRDIERTLRAFYQRLPNHIRVDDVDALPVCPPPHIFTLNILYHTSLILLYRPFFSISSSSSSSSSSPSSSSSTSAALKQRAREVCTAEAAKVHAFFRAYGHTFRWRNQTYLTTYCVYTAATIEVQQVRHPDPAVASQAVDRLATTLRMLEAECQQTPGIRRSIDIIKTQLGGVDLVALAGGTDPLALVPTTLVLDEPPPHPQPQPLPPPPPATDLGGMDLVGSGLLGPSWLDWYMPDAGGGFIPNQNT
ncbi:hypothetical protein SCUCBS95973_002864 [Sporothrix curviconia]|uniref:Uncharacterized protein n=1 Tax=Sporothrix curviconia TaxID=1260050 RepID=A0ABP0BAI0_9PEZI